MRTPTLALGGNLRWTRNGTVWADFILAGIPYGLRGLKEKRAVRALHTGLIRALPGESLLLGLCSGLDPAVIVQRMLEGVDLADCPDWKDECLATLDSLDQIGPGQRIYWLSVPLGSDKPTDRLVGPMNAAMTGLRDALGLPRASIPAADWQRRAAQAAEIAAAIPSAFDPRPATPAQMVWLHSHMVRRGLYQDLDLPSSSPEELASSLLLPKAGAALCQVCVDEGGQSDIPKAMGRVDLKGRRYLKVQDGSSLINGEASYQCVMVVSDVPDGGMVFPGSEILGRIDESGLDVDWAVRLTVRSSAAVAAKNRRALRNLNDQYGQRSGEVSHGLNMLDRCAKDLAEYVAILESDQLEVEAQATILMCVAGPTAVSVKRQSGALATFLGSTKYKLVAPQGYQEAFWWAMHPGMPAGQQVREFAQITTSSALATLVPMASLDLGDRKGSLLGLNIGNGSLIDDSTPCGPTSAVLHDLEGASDRDISGSIAIAGELGAGKTATLMKLASDVADRGGQLVISDRTQKGEWASWAGPIASAVVVDTGEPAWSLDPLRVFGARAGSRILQSFLTPLLNVPATSPTGVLISDLLNPAYLAEHELASTGAIVEHLREGCPLPGAHELYRLINVFARRDFGRVIFDGSIPALDITSRAIVIRTHTVQLPRREELEHEHLFAQMKLEKIYGRALTALVAALARDICFHDTSTLAGFVVSEAHSMTISSEGEQELVDFVRDGRKHRALAMLDSHDPIADFGSPTLRGLIPTRLLMRHTDRTLARRGLEWLDLDPNDDDLIRMVTKDTSPVESGSEVPLHRRGEATMRDLSGNIGRVKVLLPARKIRTDAISAGGRAARRTTTGPGGATHPGSDAA